MSNLRHSILHVDDDPNDVALVQRAFRKLALAVSLHCVQDGEAAIAYLSGRDTYRNRERHPFPNLVLLDLKLPRKSGFEILSWIREQPETRRLPVIILTSSRHERDVNQAYDSGANAYLVKPVGFDALVEMIEEVHAFWLALNEPPTF